MAAAPDGMIWIACLTVLASLCIWCPSARGQVREDDLVPFVLPWDDASPGITDLSAWNHKPAGRLGAVRVGEDGRLYVGDERIRFFGADLTFGATMPTKENAEGIAARSAKFGINIIPHTKDVTTWGDARIGDRINLEIDTLARYVARLRDFD